MNIIQPSRYYVCHDVMSLLQVSKGREGVIVHILSFAIKQKMFCSMPLQQFIVVNCMLFSIPRFNLQLIAEMFMIFVGTRLCMA